MLIALRYLALALGFAMVGITSTAQDLPAGAAPLLTEGPTLGILNLPVTASTDGNVTLVPIEGYVTTRTWRIDPVSGELPAVLEMIRPLRAAMQDEGFDIIVDCDSDACGGFDFRRAAPVVHAPDMYVNLRAYHAIAARRDGAAVFALVSRESDVGYVQIIDVDPPEVLTTEDQNTQAQQAEKTWDRLARRAARDDGDTLLKALENRGRAVVGGLAFDSGSARLSDSSDFTALRELAAWLTQDSTRSVILVGHTDATGGLDANIALSKRRAASVRGYLIDTLGVPRAQLTADGVGPLMPLAPHWDAAQQDRNRRVEAVILSR